jgi:hypothetical protein
MHKYLLNILVLGFCSIWASDLVHTWEEVESYQIAVFEGATGPSSMIISRADRGSDIKFTTESDKISQMTLTALKRSIYVYNTKPDSQMNIWIYGYFHPIRKKSGEASGMENCTLLGWYIRAPFINYRGIEERNDLDGLVAETKLTSDMFDLEGMSEAEKELFKKVKIEHDSRLNIYWVGARPPIVQQLDVGRYRYWEKSK